MSLPPQHLGIAGNCENASVRSLTPALARWIRARDRRVTVERELAKRVRGVGTGLPLDLLARRVDAMLVLGGDGTMLHVARAACRAEVPIFGVNLGGLGFLTETGRAQLYPSLRRLLRGDFGIERRAMVEARVRTAGKARIWSGVALNDAVLHAHDRSRTIAMDLRIGATPIGTLIADGLIVATPTGSTAYSLSAGGPVVRPTVEALLATPISPHTLTFRPLLIGADERIGVKIRSGHARAAITLDGQVSRPLAPGDDVTLRRAEDHVDLIVLEPGAFYEVLRAKLAWANTPRGAHRTS